MVGTNRSNLLGVLRLDGARLPVRDGQVSLRFTCASSELCFGLFSVDTRLEMPHSRMLARVVCTVSRAAKYRIAAHRTRTVSVQLDGACLEALRIHHNHLVVKITTRPRTGQQGLVRNGTMVLKK